MGIGPLRRIRSRRSESARSEGNEARDGDANEPATDEFVVVTNAPKDVLVYDPRGSYMISFGIDQQHADNYKHRSLGDVIKLTTYDVTLSFVMNGIIPEDNYQAFVSSEQAEECSLEGMKREIQKQASKVGNEGLLVIFLCGHGVKYGANPDRTGFVPGDYNRNEVSSVLTGSHIIKSIQNAQCKPRYTLVVLDCCYSGTMALSLTEDCSEQCVLLPNTYVLAAGSANETSLLINSLGYTIFTYFLRFALDRVRPTPGALPLSEMFDECQVCAEALSSIVIRQDESGLKYGKFKPSLAAFDPQTKLDDIPLEATDGAFGEDSSSFVPGGKTAFVFQYYQPRVDKTKPPPKLNSDTLGWLNSITTLDPSPLVLLDERNLFLEDGFDTEGRVLLAVITLLIRSVAAIEVNHKNEQVTNPNLFLLAFVEVMAALDRVHNSIKVTPHHLSEGAVYYMDALKKSKLDCMEMAKLYIRIIKDTRTTHVDDVQVSECVYMNC